MVDMVDVVEGGWAAALRLAQAQVGPETGGHLNAAPRTNDSTPIATNQ